MQIGIDLGATKIEYVVLDNNNSEIVRQRESTPSNYKKLLEVISSIIKSLSSSSPPAIMLKSFSRDKSFFSNVPILFPLFKIVKLFPTGYA